MEIFSPEDDLFITQGTRVKNQNHVSSILGDSNDLLLPCFSLMDSKYSVLSDNDFDIPSSQKSVPSQISFYSVIDCLKMMANIMF